VTIETVRECELANESGTGTASAKLPHRETSIARCWTREPYHRRQPPKSAGREQYGVEFIARLRQSGVPPRDPVAAATVLTAATIAISVKQSAAFGSADLIASSGGVHNPQVMAHLAGFLPGVDISTSIDHGVDADAEEAIAFAVLAHETWRRKPSNLPSATGAKRAVVLGSITP
jgi:anhydro-N-acetylmuramic acid kinase